MTHGDIVRQMTNEELAKMITAGKIAILKQAYKECGISKNVFSSTEHAMYCIMLEYLNREVEELDHDEG